MKRILAGTLACALLSACSGMEEPPAPQPIPVKTFVVANQAIPNVVELPGRVEPVRVAEVRARVTGIVEKRLYEEGTDVSAGQPLFRVDPRELRAAHAQTQASLARARATGPHASRRSARGPGGPSMRGSKYSIVRLVCPYSGARGGSL